MTRDSFGKKKRRTTGQEEQLKQARGGAPDASADKENVDPAPLYSKIERLECKVADVRSQLQEEKDKTAEVRARCQNTRRREERAREANVALRERLKSAEGYKDDLLAVQLSLEKTQHQASVLLTRNSALVKQAKAMSMRICRAPTTQARAVEKVRAASHLFKLQQKGIITEASRELVTDLVSLHNVPVSRVLSVIRAVAATVGVGIAGDISERSVGRIVLEGGLISQAQIVHEIQSAAGD
jgi:chromosome segregation ATPase